MDEKKIARAEHKYARISPRKVEIICNMIRGKDAKVALALMENTPKAGCELMIKVLKSAMANAENNFEMDPEKLTDDIMQNAKAFYHYPVQESYGH